MPRDNQCPSDLQRVGGAFFVIESGAETPLAARRGDCQDWVGGAPPLGIARNANGCGGLKTPEGAKNGTAVSVEYPVQLARAVKGLSGYTGPTVF